VDAAAHTFADPDEEFAWSKNLWPDALPSLRPAWEAYYRAMADLSARLLGVMALALDLPADHFATMIDRHTSAMRALDYPPVATTLDGQLGASAHTDYGTLTVLMADTTQRGLQVQGPDGEWLDATPVPGSLVVNLGDAMARWTNDRWRSTMHRVVVPTRRRQSIAFFHNANWDAVIECIPSCLEDGRGPSHPPIAAGPHLMQKFRATVNNY
jgi:isopenicillin N synthase-like dioxygenase